MFNKQYITSKPSGVSQGSAEGAAAPPPEINIHRYNIMLFP